MTETNLHSPSIAIFFFLWYITLFKRFLQMAVRVMTCWRAARVRCGISHWVKYAGFSCAPYRWSVLTGRLPNKVFACLLMFFFLEKSHKVQLLWCQMCCTSDAVIYIYFKSKEYKRKKKVFQVVSVLNFLWTAPTVFGNVGRMLLNV